MFFSTLPVLFGFVALAAGRALDVWAPPVTAPTAAAVWPQRSVQNVTWDTAGAPSQVTNPTGRVVLVKGGMLDFNHTLASNFSLSQGWVTVTVPSDVELAADYALVLFGDSGNTSPTFAITN